MEKVRKVYRDVNGLTFDEQFLWDDFMQCVEYGDFDGYTEEEFQRFLVEEGLVLDWVEGGAC